MVREPKKVKKPIEQYDHKGKKRVNNPPVGLVSPELDRERGVKAYAYDPHLDPQLQWSGKAEHTSFEVPTVSLHVHERIDPRTIIEAVRRKNTVNYEQISLFKSPEENPPLREAIEFYKHRHNWSNVVLLKVQMNTDLLTEDLKKKRAGNESFWMIGQPDVRLKKIKDKKKGLNTR